jgi:hypothetical protein
VFGRYQSDRLPFTALYTAICLDRPVVRAAVQGQQGDQRLLVGRPKSGGDQQRAEFVAVQAGGVDS